MQRNCFELINVSEEEYPISRFYHILHVESWKWVMCCIYCQFSLYCILKIILDFYVFVIGLIDIK